jgi:hypothetical protein
MAARKCARCGKRGGADRRRWRFSSDSFAAHPVRSTAPLPPAHLSELVISRLLLLVEDEATGDASQMEPAARGTPVDGG